MTRQGSRRSQAGGWVDFAAVREQVAIEEALARLKVDWLRPSGRELVGRCPVHKSEDLRSTAFHVNPERNIWKCFSCGAGGNVLDLVAALEECSVRQAALRLAEWFGLDGGSSSQPAMRRQRREASLTGSEVGEGAQNALGAHVAATRPHPQPGTLRGAAVHRPDSAPTAVNPPLGFALQSLDPRHPYFQERGLRPETVAHFGLGFCRKGMLRGRIAIPLHDELGRLIGYAGRLVPDQVQLARGVEPDGGDPPAYRLPPASKGFQKRLVLFNLHRVAAAARATGLVVVEGPFDCLRLHQAGLAHVVALLGCELTAEQEELLVRATDRVVLMLDRDAAGERAVGEILPRLARRVSVRVLDDYPAAQPDDLTDDQLRTLVRAEACLRPTNRPGT